MDVWLKREPQFRRDERQKGTQTSKWAERWKWVSKVMRCNWEKMKERYDGADWKRVGGVTEGGGER